MLQPRQRSLLAKPYITPPLFPQRLRTLPTLPTSVSEKQRPDAVADFPVVGSDFGSDGDDGADGLVAGGYGAFG